MTESYTDKTLRITVILARGKEDGIAYVFEGYACTAKIEKQGMPELPKASVTLWGLSESTMDALTTLSFEPMTLRHNQITIEAGETGKALSLVFRGDIVSAVPDFNAAPSPTMTIEARTGVFGALTPASPVSVNGQQSAESLVSGFAKEAGMTFKSTGLTASVSNCVINGDPISKMKWVAESVGAELLINDNEVSLVDSKGVLGQGSPRVTLIDPKSGQIGYPSFDDKGVRCSLFFEPSLRVMGEVEIQSAFKKANGKWRIYSLTHDLSANLPNGGSWKTEIACSWLYRMV